MTGPSVTDLLRVRAALAVGSPPAQALGAATDAQSRRMAGQLAVGESLQDIAARQRSSSGAAWLVRALALGERCGGGTVEAVDIALAARLDAMLDEQRLAAKAAQASGTARLLTVLPVAAWLLLVLVDPAALAFYGTAPGAACAVAAAALSITARRWSARLIARAAAAPAHADPLADGRQGVDPRRGAVVGVPVSIAGWTVGGPMVAVVAGVAVGAWFARGRPADPPVCSTVELLHLLRMALVHHAGPVRALEEVAAVTAPPVADRLRGVVARLRNGASLDDAFAGSGLERVSAVLDITERWGVSPADPLRLLSATVRAEQRAAAEIAGERVQLALVFPTTLLTLPAFVVAIVPPLLWTALVR